MKSQLCGIACLALALGGCGGSDSTSKIHTSSPMAMSSMMATASSTIMTMSSIMDASSSSVAPKVDLKYSITVTNLTSSQPFSPLVYSFHYSGFSPFTVGKMATIGLEKIAESGAGDDYIMSAHANADIVLANHAMGLTLPGESKTITLNLNADKTKADQLRFSLVNMLANTNDAFAGVNSVDIGKLAIGENLTVEALSYDAGTEMNTESMATIPGPAGGGEGFNANRDDEVDQVTLHPGVVTRDDGKMDSALTHVHRWDNPVARIVITRLTP